MAAPKRRPGPESPDLSTQSDFQLLNGFTSLVSKEHSQPLKEIAWEIMRRYSGCLSKSVPTRTKDYSSIIGDARWGDAKRVEAIFGMKRGVLIGLWEAGLIESNSLDKGRKKDGARPAIRAKRLYDLISVVEYVDSCADGQDNTNPP